MTKRKSVFDVDGVVFDSNGAKIKAYQEVLSQVATADELKLDEQLSVELWQDAALHMEFASNFLDRGVDPYDLSALRRRLFLCVI